MDGKGRNASAAARFRGLLYCNPAGRERASVRGNFSLRPCGGFARCGRTAFFCQAGGCALRRWQAGGGYAILLAAGCAGAFTLETLNLPSREYVLEHEAEALHRTVQAARRLRASAAME